jgi:hypothetical protein
MSAVNPDDPLFWIKSEGRNLLHMADGCLDGGLLRNNDAELMRHLRQETVRLLDHLISELGKIERSRPDAARSLGFLVAKLLSNALSIGCVAPASSESAKAAIAASRAQRARDAKTRTPRRRALDEAFRKALSVKREQRSDLWSLAGQMKSDIEKDMQAANYERGITQQAIYNRLRKHRRNQSSGRS